MVVPSCVAPAVFIVTLAVLCSPLHAVAQQTVLENPVSNKNTHVGIIDNTHFATLDDILGQRFTAAGRLVSAQMMMYAFRTPGHTTPLSFGFKSDGADGDGHLDLGTLVYSGPLFTIPPSVSSYFTATFLAGNTEDIDLESGKD